MTMNAAQNRFKQVNTPSGGSDDTKCRAWGLRYAAQNRFKQVSAPSGGSDDTKCRAWGLFL